MKSTKVQNPRRDNTIMGFKKEENTIYRSFINYNRIKLSSKKDGFKASLMTRTSDTA